MTEVIETFETTPTIRYPQIQQKTAGFWMRFWAFVLDSLIISAIVGVTIRPLFAVMDWDLVGVNWYAPFTVLSVMIYYAYFVFLTKYFKQTLGKMVFGLHVEKDNGEPLDWPTILFREGIGRFINSTFLHLPYLIVAFSQKNKSVADYFSDTIVVHEKMFVEKV
ncbi:hypothetical protein CSE16_16035 [Solibacillus sp. R5-41]|uniref:RDD family protein n=1 Tax=Solibacillus sp. R5-41 TaxID=2048654 RepID=UPI000C126740|nr:RDD family protein [Solibacillus sp. R5-41]ATP41449.1 hypothetical protein CSE16_16035 [Solibacillus sp. R5-41]